MTRRAFARAARGLSAAVLALGIAVRADGVAVSPGDAAWAERAAVLVEERPLPEVVARAVEAYESELAADPARLDVRWKLLRALYFAGYFAETDARLAAARFDRAREVAESGVERFAAGGALPPHRRSASALRAQLGSDPLRNDVARFYFWAAIGWGAWAEASGLLAAVREGVANRLRDYALVTTALEPELEAGGAHRLLARLHAKLPAIPLLSGWVDRSEAIAEAERALALAPEDPGNRLLLALTILDVGPARRDEALAILAGVAELEPRAPSKVEDLAIRRSAAERLAAERRGHAGG